VNKYVSVGSDCLDSLIKNPMLPEIKEDFSVTITDHKFNRRRVTRVSTPSIISGGVSMPYRNYSKQNMFRSLAKRIASKRPITHWYVRRNLPIFVNLLLKKCFIPLPNDVDLSLETWLQGTTYTDKRKEKLRELDEKINGLFKRKYLASKCFMKEEYYQAIDKECRGIFSRSDEVKVLIGPIVKAIENQQYLNPNFIKHIPVSSRPRFISDHLAPLGEVGESDYTAFESHFDSEMMKVLDFTFYDYMTKNLQDSSVDIIHQFDDINNLYFKDFKAKLPASRLSGEMTTSSFNGFANFALLQFVAVCSQKYFLKTGDNLISFNQLIDPIEGPDMDLMINCVIEGDDGLARYWYGLPNANLYEECGLKMKLEKKNDLSTASFCGIVFDEGSLDALCDPRKHLVKTGWLSSRYVGAKRSKRLLLLRAKAFSLAHQYPNCPILRHYADQILRHTKHLHSGMLDYIKKHAFLDEYERLMWLEFANKRLPPSPIITDGSRSVIYDLFGISIEEQKRLELWFELNGLSEIPLHLVIRFLPNDWLEFSLYFVIPVPESNQEKFIEIDFPKHRWNLVVPYVPVNA
jgi:hypothetical protein